MFTFFFTLDCSAYCHSLCSPVTVCLCGAERQIKKVTDAEAMGGDSLQEQNGFPDKNSPKHVTVSLRNPIHILHSQTSPIAHHSTLSSITGKLTMRVYLLANVWVLPFTSHIF